MTLCVSAGARLVGFVVVFFALAEAFVMEGIWRAERIEFKSDESSRGGPPNSSQRPAEPELLCASLVEGQMILSEADHLTSR
jgi:hypothetical protein